MKYSKIRGTDLEISQLILGTWVFSGINWGGSQEADSIAAVHAALDSGMTTIDTAPIYGYGLAETIIGKALKGRRDQAVLATKCGLSGRGKAVRCDLKPETIRREIEASLERLGTDYVDLYQCHWPDDATPIDETMRCLETLVRSGKVRYIGVSNFPKALIAEAGRSASIRTLQSPLSLLDRGLLDETLPFCKENNIGVLAYGALGGGILSGKYQEPPRFPRDDVRSFFYKFYAGDKFSRIQAFLNQAFALGYSLNHLALNWIRAQSGVSAAIVGCRNAAQVRQNADALLWDMDDALKSQIQKMLNENGL